MELLVNNLIMKNSLSDLSRPQMKFDKIGLYRFGLLVFAFSSQFIDIHFVFAFSFFFFFLGGGFILYFVNSVMEVKICLIMALLWFRV